MIRRPLNRIAALAVVLAAAFGGRAAAQEQPISHGIAPIEFERETLPNGLRVIYAPMRNAPVVHVRVHYLVGARDERPDRQGFAHMFEHMMFRGSAHVAPEQHMKLIGANGGSSNAFTAFDQTVYINTVPSNQVQMTLWLEADRMASFKVNEEIFRTERNVVAEEWRIRQNRPYGNLFDEFSKLMFTTHSYRWTPIGNMDHLRQAQVGELQEFYNKYYLPNNAVLVVAGDIDVEQTRKWVNEYFGWIPGGPEVERNIPAEPEQTEPRRGEVKMAVQLPVVMIGFHVPGYTSPDHIPLQLLSMVMGSGGSSRIDRALVNNEQPLCTEAGAWSYQRLDPSLFNVNGTVLQGKDPAEVEKVLRGIITDVVANGVTQEELDKAKTQYRRLMIEARKTCTDVAEQLGAEELFGGDAARVNAEWALVEATTIEDLHRVAKTYLDLNRSTTMVILPDPLGVAARAAAAQEAAKVSQMGEVAPSTKTVAARDVTFPQTYPTEPPVGEQVLKPSFEKGVESVINGVRVVVIPDHRVPTVSWSLVMRRGSHAVSPDKDGLAELTASMMRRGSAGISFAQLNEDLESRGISIGVADAGDVTRATGSCTSDQLDHAMTRFAQMLRQPDFPADEFDKLKAATLSNLVQSRENPRTVAEQELAAAVYGPQSPLGRTMTPQSVSGISLDDVKAYHRDTYCVADGVLVMSGDVTVEQGRQLASRLLDGWEPGPKVDPVTYDFAPAPTSRRVIVIDHPGARQAVIWMGLPAYTIHSDDKFGGSLVGQILSDGIDSRLGRYVRAQKGLTYGADGFFRPSRAGGMFVGMTDTKIESTLDTINAMFKVFGDMRTAEVEASELADAKTRVTGRMLMGMQTIEQQASYRTEGILNGYPIDYYDVYPARIGQVTAGEVREIAEKYIDPDRFVIVVVAPADAVKEGLSTLGPVEVVPMPNQRDKQAAIPNAGELIR